MKFFLAFIFLFYSSYWSWAQNITVSREAVGKVQDSRMNELSGLIASKRYAGKFWTHNDSGDSARVFLIDEMAQLKAVFNLEGITATDVEDIAMFQYEGRNYIVLADIGDNRAVRAFIQLYIFEEPSYYEEGETYFVSRTDIRVLKLAYDDKPRDAEAIFVDPVDLTCYLITKREFNVGVYSIPIATLKDNDSIILNRSASLPITFVTAADISRSGEYILVKNLTHVFLWKRNVGQTVVQTLNQPYLQVNYEAEPQGEAICFAERDDVFYTISERVLGLDAYLYRYTIDLLTSY
ncbi:hypothetical protein ORI89_08550 [Sphingobacterium sp. UT-1RO-CII-1]|uniref:hypothetical protein n=1 Tax=Sphingobacterium sp. UT-1RO-CII-1 TaxID=2995225 RepID=UPI00227BBD9A|nr:hypothetical protein [Sphingobacterium sp. UT-1RO-CII-1]MCY4779700.1 hypothetical protein [Sphingobacterium sp. UT-1RO-CII-1]